MKRTLTWMGYLLAAVLVFATACMLDKITNVWRDEAYTGGPAQKVIVIAVSQNTPVRKAIEDEFVRQLKGRGTEAIPGYTVIADQTNPDREALVAKIREAGADAALIMRMVRGYVSPQAQTSNMYYFYSHADGPPADFTDLQTNLYQVSTEKLLWSCGTTSTLPRPDESTIRPVVGMILGRLARDGLIK